MRPRLKTSASSSASEAPTCAISRPDRESKRAVNWRDSELVQNERLVVATALVRDSVTSRVTVPQATTARVVPVPSTKAASLPPATDR